MDMHFSEEENAFRGEVREFLRANAPESLRQNFRAGRRQARQELVDWQRVLNKRGWATPHWPKEWGGAALPPVKHDVKAAMAALKPTIALYVGSMGAKQMNFRKDNMVNRGFGEAAERIQELFLAKRKDEAIAVMPDEFVDQGALIGPPERIRERWKLWADCGLTHLKITNADDEAMELMARIAL